MINTKIDYEPIEFTMNMHIRLKIRPMYFELGFSPCHKIYGRKTVVTRLLKALDLLPTNYGLLIWDVYRPRIVQAKLFRWMQEEIRKIYPYFSDQENFEVSKKYMSPPSKPGETYCPPHLSGGAIDLTLFNAINGEELEMGSSFDDCTELAHRDYFERKSSLSLEEEIIKQRRQLLRSVMEQIGFVSYNYEWWHFDIGNIFWSRETGKPAIFGPLFGDREWPSQAQS